MKSVILSIKDNQEDSHFKTLRISSHRD
jgi:hypothetical protein